MLFINVLNQDHAHCGHFKVSDENGEIGMYHFNDILDENQSTDAVGMQLRTIITNNNIADKFALKEFLEGVP